MSDATFSRRWLVLSVIGMATSFLLTVGVAVFGMRGTASADQAPRAQSTGSANRVNAGASALFVREIGGSPKTPTPGAGTAPTIHITEEPFRPLIRAAPETPPAAAEETELPPALAREAPAPSAPSAPSRPASSERAAAPSIDRTAPPPAATSTPTPTFEPFSPATATPVPALPYQSPSASPTAAATATPVATATATATATSTPAPGPPVVSVQLSDSRVETGDSVTITVSARDDKGLDWIAWESDSGERALDRENRQECGGKTTCVQSWTVRVSRSGSHTIEARARGTSGMRSETEEAYLRVRERAPTHTPTSTPVSASSTAKRS